MRVCKQNRCGYRFPLMKWIIAYGLILVCTGTSVYALAIRGYTASRHDRFSAGYPTNPQPNTSFWLAAYDFSGVGWDADNPARSVALVSPVHFVAARHFPPAIGATLYFLNRNDILQSNTVTAYHPVTNQFGEPADVMLGELTDRSLIDNDVSYYAIATLGSEAEYEGKTVVMYGNTARAGSGTVDAFTNVSATGINTTRCFAVNYNKLVGDGDDAYVEGQDSGSPSFLIASNRLTIVGTHTAIGDSATDFTTYDGFIPHYLDQLNSAAREAGYQLTRFPAPTAESTITNVTYDGTNAVLEWNATNYLYYTLLATTNLLANPIEWEEIAPTRRPGPETVPFSMSGTNQSVSPFPLRAYRIRIEIPTAP